MVIIESFFVALFCIAVVFIVLAVLCALLKLFSYAIGFINVNGSGTQNNSEAIKQESEQPSSNEKRTGKLILKGVDEPTAAIVMATVSHDLRVPLNELSFKSIIRTK